MQEKQRRRQHALGDATVYRHILGAATIDSYLNDTPSDQSDINSCLKNVIDFCNIIKKKQFILYTRIPTLPSHMVTYIKQTMLSVKQ